MDFFLASLKDFNFLSRFWNDDNLFLNRKKTSNVAQMYTVSRKLLWHAQLASLSHSVTIPFSSWCVRWDKRIHLNFVTWNGFKVEIIAWLHNISIRATTRSSSRRNLLCNLKTKTTTFQLIWWYLSHTPWIISQTEIRQVLPQRT